MAGSRNRAGGPDAQQHDAETGRILSCFFLLVFLTLGYLFLHLSFCLRVSRICHPSNECRAAASVGRKSEG